MLLDRIKEDFPEIDIEIISEVIYWNGWIGYEDSSGILIFKAFDDSYQLVEYGYCCGVDPPHYFFINEIPENQVKTEIEEMERLINEYNY